MRSEVDAEPAAVLEPSGAGASASIADEGVAACDPAAPAMRLVRPRVHTACATSTEIVRAGPGAFSSLAALPFTAGHATGAAMPLVCLQVDAETGASLEALVTWSANASSAKLRGPARVATGAAMLRVRRHLHATPTTEFFPIRARWSGSLVGRAGSKETQRDGHRDATMHDTPPCRVRSTSGASRVAFESSRDVGVKPFRSGGERLQQRR